MVWALAMTVAGTIKRDGLISAGNWNIEPRPILARPGIAVNQHDGPSFTLPHHVKIGVVDLNKKRFSARMIVGHTTGDISLFESAGNFHDLNWTRDLRDIAAFVRDVFRRVNSSGAA